MKFFKKREESHLPSVIMSAAVNGNAVLAEFVNGELVAEDPATIELLIEMGYRHEDELAAENTPDAPVGEENGETGTQAPVGEEGDSAGTDVAKMTKGEISAYALNKYGAEISTAQSKNEMLVMLQAAMESAGEK